MRITILVNNIDTEHPRATTTLFAFSAVMRGHTVHMIGLDELNLYEDGRLGGVARRVAAEVATQADYLTAIQADTALRETVTTDDMDLFWLRYNPSEEIELHRWWGQDVGLLFGRLAMARGVMTVPNPDSVLFARDKMYLQHFPEHVRPHGVITRDIDEVRKFLDRTGRAVIKPLNAYGGADVFLLKDTTNLKQIVDCVCRSGFALVQEFIEAATEGDTRFYLVDGEPLVVDGKYAAIRRLPDTDDFRANLTAGGRAEAPVITPEILRLAEVVGPRLRDDGIFFAGVDIVGDRIVEINTISTGALTATSRIQGVDFGGAVIERLERKLLAAAG